MRHILGYYANHTKLTERQMTKKDAASKQAGTKAGSKSAPPAKAGKHLTTQEDRKRGRFLSKFGLKPYERPLAWYKE
jgi:hypothetical protein